MPAVVPWIPAGPPPFVTPAVAPPCRLANLRVDLRSADKSGLFGYGMTGGQTSGAVILRNVGPPCSLLGRPHVRFVGGPAAHVPQTEGPLLDKSFAPAPDGLPPLFSVRAIPTGRSAQAFLVWSVWCTRPSKGDGSAVATPPTRVEVELPSGDVLRLPVGATPRCWTTNAGSSLAAGVFAPFIPPAKPSTAIPLTATLDRRTYRIAGGSTLHYRVTLHNGGTRAFHFARCPPYVERLGDATEAHYLNCAGDRTIAPGASVTFAMEIHVPPTGRGLSWFLAPRAYAAPFGGARTVRTR